MSLSVRELCLYFLKLGAIGFGGPVALMAYMQRDLVDRRRAFSQDQFQQGMALAQLAPGPTAALLCIYLGWVRAGWWGGMLTGFCFVLPSFLMMLGLGVFYLNFGMRPWVHYVLQGCTPAVLVLLWVGSFRLAKKNLSRNSMLWVLALLNCVAVFLRLDHLVSILLLSGIAYAIYQKQKGSVLYSGAPLVFAAGGWFSLDADRFWQIFFFFAKVGAFVFGGGMVIVPYLQSGIVENMRWLTQQQFLDAVAFAMLTPGPIVIVATFIGFLVAGVFGAIAGTIGIFLPAFVIVVVFGPLLQKWSKVSFINDSITGIISAAVGAMIGSILLLTLGGISSWVSATLALVCLLAMVSTRKIPDPVLILLAGGVGLLLGKTGFF